jgi:Tfp pilus assembly protein PilF
LADDATRKALELDPSLAEAHVARASALSNAWRWSEAEPEFRRAIELNPNNANAHYFYAYEFLVPEKRMDEAMKELQTALSLDPLSSIINMNYAVALMIQGRYPESLAQFGKVLERDPSFRPVHFYRSVFYATTGRFADAVSELQSFDFTPGDWKADAQSYAQLMLAEEGRSIVDSWTDIALAFALAGDRDKAFEYLEKSLRSGDAELADGIRFPGFESIRSDRRYADFMHRLGLPE